MRRYVLLDRDGTIIVERNYLSDPAEVALAPGAGAGLRRLRRFGFGLAVVSNQSGVGRGMFGLDAVERVNARMRDLLRAEGVDLAAVYVCPHAPEEGCECRKPKPGLVVRAAGELGFDPTRAIVVGDKKDDVDLGHAVGAATVLLRQGHGAEAERDPACRPDFVADDLAAAAEWIVGRFAAGDA